MDQTYDNKAIDKKKQIIIRKSTMGLKRWFRVVKHASLL